MTDDTDHDDHGDDERAVSLPLVDSFAALRAELDAKTDRIERLEAELDRRYLDPDRATTVTEDTDDPDATAPRSPGDWEPATDPLRDAGAPTRDGDRDRTTPSAESSADIDDSGLAPVRTASSADRAARKRRDPPAEGPASERDEPAGVTMEAGSDMTGGSLGSTADALSVRAPATEGGDEADEGNDSAAETAAPDPTADRGERLSRLVRRAERREAEEVIDAFVEGIEALDGVTRAMLAHYRAVGEAVPVDAHVAAGGSGERQYAYARVRTLRKAGVIEHDDAGRYRYALPDLVADAFDGNADDRTVGDVVDAIEAAVDLE